MASSSSEIKNLFEIRRFDGTGFDLWKDRMQGILFLKDCDGALQEAKPEDMTENAWETLNKKAVTYIKMGVSDDILLELKGLRYAFEVWEKLRASYENTTPVNQVHLMRKLMHMQLDDSKNALEHLSAFTGVLSQLQDFGLPPFDDKLKAIILLMTLPDSWETLVVSVSNNPNLTFDGVRGSILNEEIRRKDNGKTGGSANMARGRTNKKGAYAQKNKSRSKSRDKQVEVTCYQCGRKGHKKPDCRYYKKEQERKKTANSDKKKKEENVETGDSSNSKGKEKANVASSVIIEDLSDLEDILTVSMSPLDAFAGNMQDMQITKADVIDALLSTNDALSQSWIVDSGASFHVTPSKECFSTLNARMYGKVYLGNNHACSIEGIGTMHLALENGRELVLHDVRYVPGIKKSLLSVGQLDLHGYTSVFSGGTWKLIKGSMLVVKGNKKGTL